MSAVANCVPHAERIRRIEASVQGAWAFRGVASWEQEWLEYWKRLPRLTELQEQRLQSIEKQVFGVMA